MKKVDESRIEELLAELTLEEKIAMIHGEGVFQTGAVERLGIPPLIMSDGPMGVRKEFDVKKWIGIGATFDFVSYLPSNSALAATWNRDLAYRTGQVLGAEARGRGKDVILAPGINIKRSPLCGRNFEYMSEDPKLISELVVPLIKGIQENDVAACVKHFAANNQETNRLHVDTDIDERTLHEIYFPGFKAAIDKGESHTIMGAYNQLYHEQCSQSRYLLSTVLREEWGYDGAVISDWGGVHDTVEAAESGLDIEMSVGPDFDHYYMAEPLLAAVKAGKIKESHLDKKIRNILRTMLRLNMLGEERKIRKTGTYNTPEHRAAVLQVARESIILLKNEDAFLPIKKDRLKTLAVIGENAVRQHAGGGGSAEIKALYEISPLMGLKVKLGGNVRINHAKGYYVPPKQEKELNWQQNSLAGTPEISEEDLMRRLQEETDKKKDQLFKEAVALAEASDEVIFIGGLNHDYDVEGKDRKDMSLPYGQEELINALLDVNPDVIITIVAGSPVEMRSWADRAKAIVWNYYDGMEGGNALAEVLLGEVNPSGRIPETFPKKLADSPAHIAGEFGKVKSVTYKEGIFVGYRHYDTLQVEPEFCFGHGLSYTDFEYRDLKVTETYPSEQEDDVAIQVEVTIKNTGGAFGAETVQVYVSDKLASVERPEHELKDFTKVFLMAGEERRVRMTLHKEAFSFYDILLKIFRTEPGEFEIQVGSSARDIRAAQIITLTKKYQYR